MPRLTKSSAPPNSCWLIVGSAGVPARLVGAEESCLTSAMVNPGFAALCADPVSIASYGAEALTILPVPSTPYAPACNAERVSVPAPTPAWPAAVIALAGTSPAPIAPIMSPPESTTDCKPSALVVATSAAASAPANASPMPAVRPEVTPASNPRLRSPVIAAVPIPLRAAVPSVPNFRAPPSAPNRRGRNASGCPVTGFVVSCPVGESAAMPATSMGFMCTSMVSP